MTITDKVKTYEDVCAVDGVDPIQSLPYPEPKTDEEKAVNGVAKAFRVARVLNEGWQPDWSNDYECKYYPWFWMNSDADGAVGSGPGFSYDDYGHGLSFSRVGSRLCFKSRELAKYAGTQFLSIYREYMVIEK